MEDGLSFLVRLVVERINQVRAAITQESQGRGYRLVEFIEEVCDNAESSANAVNAQLPLIDDDEVRLRERELLRLRDDLGLVHRLVAHYRGDPGRRDLPVGLLHLIDELMRDLLFVKADPIVHLDVDNMYSTLPILSVVQGLLPQPFAEPHPVAFNLPALDPANALLSPILAHEVGHTAWAQGLRDRFNNKADLEGVSERLKAASHAGGYDPTHIAKSFDEWRQELLCDALACALTGPSFLYASAVFLPGPAGGVLGTHPYPRDRISYILRFLERLGWEPMLERTTPGVLSWCRDLGARPLLAGGEIEAGLRDACEMLEPAMQEVAIEAAGNAVDPDAFDACEQELFDYLQLEVPPVHLTGGYTSPWMIVAAAWGHEVRARGDVPEALASASSDRRLNDFLIKAIELSGIGMLWSKNDDPAS